MNPMPICASGPRLNNCSWSSSDRRSWNLVKTEKCASYVTAFNGVPYFNHTSKKIRSRLLRTLPALLSNSDLEIRSG